MVKEFTNLIQPNIVILHAPDSDASSRSKRSCSVSLALEADGSGTGRSPLPLSTRPESSSLGQSTWLESIERVSRSGSSLRYSMPTVFLMYRAELSPDLTLSQNPFLCMLRMKWKGTRYFLAVRFSLPRLAHLSSLLKNEGHLLTKRGSFPFTFSSLASHPSQIIFPPNT